MNFRFRHSEQPTLEAPAVALPTHQVTSEFVTGLCRFTLSCTCGAEFDTPYIDEALEYRELHTSLAPLADQLLD
jgi:hypothetical protein